jgi:chromosomal replication initiator protein
MDSSPQATWQECLTIIQDNITRQSYKTWFEPLEAVDLKEEDGLRKLTIQLPSRFYYEWLEEHYFTLLRKTVTKVLGSNGRLFYDIVIEQESEGGSEQQGRDDSGGGSHVHMPARPSESGGGSSPAAGSASSPQATEQQEQSASQTGKQQDAFEQHEARQSENAPGDDEATRPELPEQQQQAPRRGNRPSRKKPPRSRQQQNGGTRDAEAGAEEEDEEMSQVTNPFDAPGINQSEVDSQLNDSYTFERFIEGDCNQLARSASVAISEEPGATSFNPFLVYGGVGLGKTHLIHAIGNHAKKHGKAESVLYVSSERFTTEFVQAIQHNNISEFSLFYRQIDLLIVDDVQFFSGKEKTQEEFFHIFNALHQSGKQIVLSSDRPPREIEGIEERLLSRFQWGLSADVQPPGLETRIAILQRKAEDDGIEVPQEIIEFIARNIERNIRELEGALIRLLAQSSLDARPLDLQLAKQVLGDLIEEEQRSMQLTVDQIQKIVAEFFDIPEDLLHGRTRKRAVVRARKMAMYFCKQLTQHSLKAIGQRFGGRDHSTVIHANNSVEDQIETDPDYADTVEEVRQRIEMQGR